MIQLIHQSYSIDKQYIGWNSIGRVKCSQEQTNGSYLRTIWFTKRVLVVQKILAGSPRLSRYNHRMVQISLNSAVLAIFQCTGRKSLIEESIGTGTRSRTIYVIDMQEIYMNVTHAYRWRCPNKHCRKAKSIRHDSWFSMSHLSLEQILELTFLWTEGMSGETVRKWTVGVNKNRS